MDPLLVNYTGGLYMCYEVGFVHCIELNFVHEVVRVRAVKKEKSEVGSNAAAYFHLAPRTDWRVSPPRNTRARRRVLPARVQGTTHPAH